MRRLGGKPDNIQGDDMGKTWSIVTEADSLAWRFRWVHELAYGIEDDAETGVVTLLEFRDFAGETRHGKGHAAQADKRTHHGHAHLDGLGAIEHVGGHDGPVFGERIRQIATPAPAV